MLKRLISVVVGPADIAGAASSAVAEVASSAVIVEVASSTDPVGFVGPSGTFGSSCENSSLASDGCIEDCGNIAEVASLDEHELGGPTDVEPPVAVEEHCPSGDQSPMNVGLSLADEDTLSEEHEAIVVGAVHTGAPWFLTGWGEGTEVEFMIYTGCQVTILATSVFERMCAADPLFGSRLRPCSWRMVSALMVWGELYMTIVFPGLQCDMVLVVASIGSEALLGTEALQSCLPHQLDLRTGQLWADGQSTLQLHQQRQAVWESAHI